MANERLRQALFTAGISADELALRVGTDTKTVERWISQDRIPHRRNRASTVRVLGVDESILWPQIADAHAHAVVGPEVLHVYPDRGSVPPSSWYELLERARERVDVLVFAGLLLSDDAEDREPSRGARVPRRSRTCGKGHIALCRKARATAPAIATISSTPAIQRVWSIDGPAPLARRGLTPAEFGEGISQRGAWWASSRATARRIDAAGCALDAAEAVSDGRP